MKSLEVDVDEITRGCDGAGVAMVVRDAGGWPKVVDRKGRRSGLE